VLDAWPSHADNLSCPKDDCDRFVDIQQSLWESVSSFFTSAQIILGSLVTLILAVMNVILLTVNLRERMQKREPPGQTPIRSG